MPTYVYETVPTKSGEEVIQFEIKQSMKDEPLKHHPETGQPVRRVISGGYGFSGSSKGKLRSSDSCCTSGGCASC